MNRQGLKDEVRQALGGTATPMAASLALEAVLQSIQEGLFEDGEVKISGFGQFTIHELAARSIHNPQGGTQRHIPSHKILRFKAAPKQQMINSSPLY